MGHFREIIFCLCLLSSTTLTLAETTPEVEVVPEEYDIKLITTNEHFNDNDKDLKFDGTVNVVFKFVNPPQSKFHFCVDIVPETHIENVILKEVTDLSNLKELQSSFTKSGGKLNVTCEEVLQLGELKKFAVEITFKNVFKNDMTGFYRSSYVKDGKKRWILTTHFEPNYARSAFPCFDKPNLKAHFKLNIIYPALEGYHVLCNTIPTSNDLDQTNKIATCPSTPVPMPTYLVAFVISDLDKTEQVLFKSDYPQLSDRYIVTYGRKDMIQNKEGQLSLDVAKEAVTLLGEYTELGYAFPKIDMVGIPDFSAGAMENWGLITYREKILFYNEEKSSVALKQSTTLTVVHELVHQWFGNLVTLASWNYIWLNEAFATYLSYVIAREIKNPSTEDWQYSGHMMVNEIHLRAFEIDGLGSAKPLTQDIKNETLVAAAFDDIPYAKGCAVLRMWDLSLNSFKQGIIHYIKNNAQKVVEPKHLFNSLESQSGMTESFFKTWTENPGYPVVEVQKTGNEIYTLSQSRFFWEKTNLKKDIMYTIPITYTDSESQQKFEPTAHNWLTGPEIKLTLKGEHFIINNVQAGYYRVNYNKENWLALAKALNSSDHSKIIYPNRAQIIDDVFSLARSVYKKYVDYEIAFTIASYLTKEKNYFVWKTALNSFEFLNSKLAHDQNLSKQFQEYILELLKPHFKPLNSTEKGHLDRLMARQISHWACNLGYEPCIKQAQELYKTASKYTEVEEVILCTAARTDASVWNNLFQMYKNEIDSSRKLMYLSAMGCTGDKEKIEGYLALTLKSDSDIRKQDCSSAFSSVFRGNSKNIPIALKFIEDRYEEIGKHYGGINPLGKAIVGIATKLHTKNDIERIVKLTEKIKASTTVIVPPDNLANAISIVKVNEEWIQERAGDIKKYMNSGSTIPLSMVLLTLCSTFAYYF